MNEQTAEPQTIVDLLLELGQPRNYAEQCIMERMAADARDMLRSSALGTGIAFAAYSQALARYHAILSFRQYAGMPPIGEQKESTP